MAARQQVVHLQAAGSGRDVPPAAARARRLKVAHRRAARLGRTTPAGRGRTLADRDPATAALLDRAETLLTIAAWLLGALLAVKVVLVWIGGAL